MGKLRRRHWKIGVIHPPLPYGTRQNGSSDSVICRWVNACFRFRLAAALSVIRLYGVLCVLTLRSVVYQSSRAQLDFSLMQWLYFCSVYRAWQAMFSASSLICQAVSCKTTVS